MNLRRLPLIPTILVIAAVATMIGLGLWQISRAGEKRDLIALYRANPAKPALMFPLLGPVPPAAVFRRSTVQCIEVVGWRTELGAAFDGTPGYRQIAQCRTGAEGPGALVDMGVPSATNLALDPNYRPRWAGGEARGIISTEPDHRSLLSRLFGRDKVLLPMLVSSQPAPGLRPSARPNPESVPNNHLFYAGQWFFFAAAASVIYVLALRKRLRGEVA